MTYQPKPGKVDLSSTLDPREGVFSRVEENLPVLAGGVSV